MQQQKAALCQHLHVLMPGQQQVRHFADEHAMPVQEQLLHKPCVHPDLLLHCSAALHYATLQLMYHRSYSLYLIYIYLLYPSLSFAHKGKQYYYLDKISSPLSVITNVCSHCALGSSSSVTTVQSSSESMNTFHVPILIIGSMVNTIPGTSNIPVPL